MSTITTIPEPKSDEEKQILDIAKEIFTNENISTKSDLSEKEVAIYARALWFSAQYEIPELKIIVSNLLLLKRSKKAKALNAFAEVLKHMKPEFEQKTGGAEMKL